MKKISILGLILAMSLLFVVPVSAETVSSTEEDIPVYYEEPDWSDPELPKTFIVANLNPVQKTTRSFRETLLVSYRQLRYRNSTGVMNWGHTYVTRTFANGYTFSTTYTYVADRLDGVEYLAKLTYSFY